MFSPEGQKKVEFLLSRYPIKKNALLPILHLAQQENRGYLTSEWLDHVAEVCEVPPTHVEGVATFYTMYKFKPVGKFHLQVCTNVSCGLCGGEEILEALEKKFEIHAGETTEDGYFSLEEVECLGACANAPVMIVNEKYHEDLDVNASLKLAEQLEKEAKQQEWPQREIPTISNS